MTREFYKLYHLVVLVCFAEIFCQEVFGLKLSRQAQKSQETTQYRFHYFVKDETTGDYKVQEETKEGDSVHGSYTIAEPNGDLRTVTYEAGPGKGFEAKVNVQPNASPMKPILETTIAPYTTARDLDQHNQTETSPASTVKHFPGGFTMDVITKPEQKMGMNFSLKTAVTKTEGSTIPTTEYTIIETTPQEISTPDDVQKQQSFPTEGRGISEDSIEKEIDEALNSMPKLPELVLPDNKTHLKFQKDPEEALLDERITQIARQLAETSLRKEYEERKLGHIIPISVTPITTSRYMSKSFKFRPSEGPLQVLNHVSLVPQYVYRETQFPRFFAFDRIPMVRPTSNVGTILRQYSTTQDIQKTKADNPTTEFKEPIPVMPIHVPTFMQFFSPYVTPTIKTKQNVPENQISTVPPFKQLTDSISLTTDTTSTQVKETDKSSKP